MNTIKVNEEVLDQLPEEFKNLPDVTYTLTKTENFRPGYVYEGDTVRGPAEIVKIVGKPGVKVWNDKAERISDLTYIRTSPIVKILDKTDTSIIFQTEGGIYKLEKA